MPNLESWVLCRIFLKKRSNKTEDEENSNNNENGVRRVRNNNGKPVLFYDFMRKNGTDLNLMPSSSSSGSSGVTEVTTCNESEDHEESSCNSFPYFRRKQPSN